MKTLIDVGIVVMTFIAGIVTGVILYVEPKAIALTNSKDFKYHESVKIIDNGFYGNCTGYIMENRGKGVYGVRLSGCPNDAYVREDLQFNSEQLEGVK